MPDANIRIPVELEARLSTIAASKNMSLRAYLTHLADTLAIPEERAERSEHADTAMQQWIAFSGYSPTRAEERHLDEELKSRLTQTDHN